MRKIAVVLVLIVLAACGNGGINGGMTCARTNGRGLCSGTLDQLNGANTLIFDMHELNSGNSVQMQLTMSVKTGAVNITFVNAAGQTVSKSATREVPLTVIETINGVLQVTLNSTHGISTGVQYLAEFTG